MKFSIREYSPMAALLFAACFATSCPNAVAQPAGVPKPAATASAPSSPPSLVDTVPADSTKNTPSTTSTTKSEISKEQQSNDMPMPGQANDHSTLAPDATQKSDTKKR